MRPTLARINELEVQFNDPLLRRPIQFVAAQITLLRQEFGGCGNIALMDQKIEIPGLPEGNVAVKSDETKQVLEWV